MLFDNKIILNFIAFIKTNLFYKNKYIKHE